MNRKAFLYNSSIILGGTLLGCNTFRKVTQTASKTNYTFDLHTHPGAFFRKGHPSYAGDQAFYSRVKEMQEKGLKGAFFAIVADVPLLTITEKGVVPSGSFKGNEGWKEFNRQFKILKDLLAESSATIALEVGKKSETDKIQAFLACEGGDFLDDKIENVEKAYQMGLRSIQLVHYAPNRLGDLQTWKAKHSGLSTFGKAVVQEMNKLGMVIDVAHASAKTVKDVIELTKAPIILSHSILKTSANRPASARAISIGHAKMVADTGGIIGMWPSGFSSSFDDFVDHTFRMIDAVGIDAVGIGTDMDGNFKPVISDYDTFFDWKDRLIAKGLNQVEASKIIGGNMQRVLEAVL